MTGAVNLTTRAQMILPKVLREWLRWPAGTGLEVELTGDGAVFKAARLFPPSKSEDVLSTSCSACTGLGGGWR